MVSTDIVVLSIILGIVLIATGYYFKKKGFYLSLFGSILLSVTGIIMITNPIEFVSGTITTITNSTYTTSVTYATQSSGLNSALSLVMLFIGIAGMYLSIYNLYNHRYEEEEQNADF